MNKSNGLQVATMAEALRCRRRIGNELSMDRSESKAAQADVRIAIGAGTDVAMETADVVLMKSDPFDVIGTVILSRATRRKMRQNLWWAGTTSLPSRSPSVCSIP